ncbi:unnamed protein product [Discula destructiva]
MPVPLNDISALHLAAEWAMTAGNGPSEKKGVDTNINSAKAKCNVAFDLFLDRDPENASSAVNAAYEIMVWIGRVGQPYPLGYDSKNASCYTQKLGSFNFTLYSGQNSRGTSVFTWVSPTNNTAFDEDISPLLQYLWRNELVSADARLGLVEFGSEAYHSTSNVTFSAGKFSMDIRKGEPPEIDMNAIGEACMMPMSPGGSQGTGKPKQGAGVRIGGLNSMLFAMATSFTMLLTFRRNERVPFGLAAVVLWWFGLF